MIPEVSRILKVFSDTGLFDEGVELIGSWCFQLYQKHLGVSQFPLLTQDIDFLIPNPFRGQEHADFLDQLTKLGFNHSFSKDGSLYLWSADFKIEFITPDKGRGANSAIFVKQLGLRAIPLRFVDFLLEDPITIKEGGMKVLVPQPANFCLHKLTIASRRRNKDRSLKDLQHAIAVSAIVPPGKMLSTFKSLPRSWQKVITMVLEKSEEKLPLMADEIGTLKVTLQTGK